MISPKTGALWNLAFLILTGIAAGTVDFAGISADLAHTIRAWAANGAFIISSVNLVFHLYAGPGSGPMVK